MAMNKYLSIITLNINGLNALMKRHRVAEWIRKHDSHICYLQETRLRTKDLHRLKVNKFSRQMDRKKKGGAAIFISDKIDLKTRDIERDPEGHFIILNERIHQEDMNIINMYATN